MATKYDGRIERLAQQAGEGEPPFCGAHMFTRAEYERWLQTDEGRAYGGQPHDGGPHHGGRRVLTGFNMIVG